MIRRSGFVLTIALAAHLSACSDNPQDCAGKAQVLSGSIEITGAKGSARVQDLECVQVVNGSVTISDPTLRSLEPLSSLIHVLGNVIVENAPLQSLHGLERLAEVGGGIRLSELGEIESLDGLQGLRKLDGALVISELPKLASLEALGALEAIGGSLSLESLASVVTLKGLGAIAHIGKAFQLDSNPLLTDLDALDSLVTIDGDYRVLNNAALVSASFGSQDPSRVPSVGGDIHIRENGSLKTLTRFAMPREYRGPCDDQGILSGIHVVDNDSLEILELPDVRRVHVTIRDNPRLIALSSPDKFGTACRFALSSLPSLTSVSLPGWNLDSLEISNTGLTTLDGFENIAVSCHLNISKNAALEDVAALASGVGVARWFEISQNPSLDSCQAQALLDPVPTPPSECGRVDRSRIISVEGNDDSAVCE